MGYWLIAAIALQLACALCAAKLDRPAVWLQFILLVPFFGALAFCISEVSRHLSATVAVPARVPAAKPRAVALGGLGYRAVSARTAESRRALAAECTLMGRHADARLLLASCSDRPEAEAPTFVGGSRRAPAGLETEAGSGGSGD